METQYWQHPAATITFLSEETKDTSTVQIYTDGSKSEKGVGEGIAIYMSGDLIKSLKYKLNNRCTNNQAEQLAILNPSAWGHLNRSSYCDVGRLFYGVFKLWSKLQRKK